MLASYNADGNLRWQQASRQHTNGTFGNAIRMNEQGNSYIDGQFLNCMALLQNSNKKGSEQHCIVWIVKGNVSTSS